MALRQVVAGQDAARRNALHAHCEERDKKQDGNLSQIGLHPNVSTTGSAKLPSGEDRPAKIGVVRNKSIRHYAVVRNKSIGHYAASFSRLYS